jgi:hypothetical protein
MAKQPAIELYPLEEIKTKIYKKQKLTEPVKTKRKNLLDDVKKLHMAARFCDSTYHLVNSEISKVLSQKKNMLSRGLISDLISELVPEEAIHGQRFVILKKGKQAYLLGDTLTALKKLSN